MDNDSILSIINNIFSNESVFLKNIYNISSYEEGILYLNNNNLYDYTKLRILNFLYLIYIKEDIFPCKEYINHLYNCFFNITGVKLKKSGLKNMFMNNKYENKKPYILNLIDENIKNIIEE